MPGPVLMMGAHTRTTQEPHQTHTRTICEPFANHLRTIWPCRPAGRSTDRPMIDRPADRPVGRPAGWSAGRPVAQTGELRRRSIDPHLNHTRTTPEPFANHLRTIGEPFWTYCAIAACSWGTLESKHVPCSMAMPSGIAVQTGCTPHGMVNTPLTVATFPSSPRESKFSLFSMSLHPN